MCKHDAGNPRQFLSRQWFQGVLPCIEQHIGNVDDQSARRLARIQDQVQLLDELGTKFPLFRLSSGRCLARLFGRCVLVQCPSFFRFGLCLRGHAFGLGTRGRLPCLFGRGLISECAFPCHFCYSLCCSPFRFGSRPALRFESLLRFGLSSPASVFLGLRFCTFRLSLRLRFAVGCRLTFQSDPPLILTLERDQPRVFRGLCCFARGHGNGLRSGLTGFVRFGLLKELLCFLE